MKIVTSVIPAAGFGTRFLPYTKVVPKELLPLIDKPVIHYVVDESVRSDVHSICIVSNERKRSISDYFSRDEKLESFLRAHDKMHRLDELNSLIDAIDLHFVDQDKPCGFADAVARCRTLIGDSYFGIMLPDDIICSQEPGLAQLIRVAREQSASVIAVQDVGKERIQNYGAVAIKRQVNDSLFEIASLHEKPRRGEEPSTLGVIGRYIMAPAIFESIDQCSFDTQEVMFTEAVNTMIDRGHPVYAYCIEGDRYDVGTPDGFAATVESFSRQCCGTHWRV